MSFLEEEMMNPIHRNILAIDPGNQKCGLAITDHEGTVLKKMVAPADKLVEMVGALCREFSIAVIVIGDRTYSKKVRESLQSLNLAIESVDENRSSIEGRYRYLKENTTGLAKLLPIGLRTPKQPYDDYVAVVLAERFLKGNPNYSQKTR